MSSFLCGKAFVLVHLPVFPTACASQSAPDNFEITDLASSEIEFTAYTGPLLMNVDDHRSAPSSHAAIGEFTDVLRGEPLGLGDETDVQ